MSYGSHFLDNCPHCPGHDAYGVMFYIFLPDHTEVKYGERALRPAISQQILNELLLRARFCTGWVSSLSLTHTCSSAAPCYLSPPQCALFGPPALPRELQAQSKHLFIPLHHAPPKRRDSELFPPRSREGFETNSEKLNSLLQVLL